MQIKRFEAKDMTEALKMIKNEFGSQAVILSAKTIKKSNGLFGAIRKAGVEITAASDRYRSIDYNTKSTSVSKEDSAPTLDNFHPIGEKIKYLKSEEKIKSSNIPSSTKDDFLLPSHHVKENKESPFISKIQSLLKEQDVAEYIVQQIVASIYKETQHQNSTDFDAIKTIFSRYLSSKIDIGKPIALQHGRAAIIAFVGPTGVGKTTTIAKLGAISALEKEYSVALISLDHQRVGATTTLERYAGIIGVPYKTVATEDELKSAVREFRNKHFILVDTPGIVLTDGEKITHLAKQIVGISPDEVYLLLSATTKDKDMIRLCKAYKSCRTNRLIITKLDETASLGNILNLMDINRLPLTYLTNGQQIPEHIIAVEPNTISNLFLKSINLDELGRPQIDPAKESDETPQFNFLPPGDYFIANKNSDIFHHRSCKAVERINMNNVVVFQTIFDARDQSFKPCRMCCYEKLGSERLVQRFKNHVAVGR